MLVCYNWFIEQVFSYVRCNQCKIYPFFKARQWKLTKNAIMLSSVMRKKGESQNECFKKTKHAKFSEKRTFLTPWYAHVRKTNISYPPDTHMYVCVSGGKKCSFFKKLDVLYFLETPVLRFALLPYYRRYM